MRSRFNLALGLATLISPIFVSADPYFTYLDLGYPGGTPGGITNAGWAWGVRPEPNFDRPPIPFLRNGAASLPTPGSSAASDDGLGGVYVLGGLTRANARLGESVTIPSAKYIYGVNQSGKVVGLSATNDILLYSDQGAGWSSQVLFNGGPGAGKLYISDSGYVAGTFGDSTTNEAKHAFVWKDGIFKDLGPGLAMDVNDNGQVLVANAGLPSQAWVYDARTSQTTMVSDESDAYVVTSINRWGQVSGALLRQGLTFLPIIWQDGRVIKLRPLMTGSPFSLWVPTEINDKGQLIGYGKYPNDATGKLQAVVLTPVGGTSSFFPESAPMNGNSLSALFSNAATEKWYALNISGSLADSPSGPSLAPASAAIRPTAFKYVATGATRFTGIHDFPNGFDKPVSVSVDGIVLGTFAPGQSLNFGDYAAQLGSRLIEGGVKSFDIAGIADIADIAVADRAAFAVNLLLSLSNGDFSIHARNSRSGDLNGDGHTSFADFKILERNWGLGGLSWYDGDIDVDGELTSADYFALKNNFDVAPDFSERATMNLFEIRVPEPSSVGLLVIAFTAALRRRRR